MNKLSLLVRTGKTVFSIPELIDLWETDRDTVKTTVYRMVKQKNLYRLQPGLFSVSKRVNLFELGCKLMLGSYVSLFSVLKEKGVIFQEYKTVYCIAPRPRNITVGEHSFEYHRIGNVVTLPDGIEFHEFYSIAGLERAILDTFCLFDTDYSDFKMSGFDKEKFLHLSTFYNKKTQQKARQFLKDASL